ncbi:transcriptional regulator [Rhodoferax ferrireducens]|uniref:transcriptional regulator n=1 Tax=Rhodoferax ferrireducens TaxID=192843 RepID=UPI000E0CBFB5
MHFKNYFFGLARKDRPAFAEKVGTTAGHLTNFCYGYTPLAPAVCVAIEQVTNGEVTRQELRPDDWHLNWPELTKVAEKSVN